MEMTKEERQEWLDNLQVGDEVCLIGGSYGYPKRSIERIKKITPTRRMDVAYIRVDNTGYEMKHSSSWSPKWHIEPVTDAIRREARRNAMASKLNESVKFEKLSLAQLKAIQLIVESESFTEEKLALVESSIQSQ